MPPRLSGPLNTLAPGAARAVVHAGHHEETGKVARFCQRVVVSAIAVAVVVTLIALRVDNGRVIVERNERRDERIGEPVVHDELAAALPERREIGIIGIERLRPGLAACCRLRVGNLHIVVEVDVQEIEIFGCPAKTPSWKNDAALPPGTLWPTSTCRQNASLPRAKPGKIWRWFCEFTGP